MLALHEIVAEVPWHDEEVVGCHGVGVGFGYDRNHRAGSQASELVLIHFGDVRNFIRAKTAELQKDVPLG